MLMRWDWPCVTKKVEKGPFQDLFKDFAFNRIETHGAVVGNVWSSSRLSVSNLCDLIKLLQLFPACFMHTPFVTLSMFVALSNFRRLINLLWFSHPFPSIHFFYVIYAPFKCTCCTHHKHNSLPCLIVRTLSAPIYLSKSPGVIGHRAILTMGDRTVAGGFLDKQSASLYVLRVAIFMYGTCNFQAPVSRYHCHCWGIGE